ncbi:hypothetical protein AB6D04_10935 [Vibrio splendidus]|uniref:hypothetical protein n=1 Tax=Vibrio splendidus TaxID=29497 RepID=UPI000C825E1A|nr:hypothetical protein [Vibrio splendidus]PMN78450.1 hypothetical protein BCT24_04510 [Vibrio splendidus]
MIINQPLKLISLIILFIGSMLVEYGGYKLSFVTTLIAFFYIISDLTKYKKNQLIITLFSFCLLITMYGYVASNGLNIEYNNEDYSAKLRSLLFFFVAYNIVYISGFLTDRVLVSRALLYALSFVIIFWFIDAVSFYLFSVSLNFPLILNGIEQRAMSAYFYRPTGLFAEPGTFFTYTYVFILIYGVETKFTQKPYYIFSLAIILSLSVQGIFLGVGLLLLPFIHKISIKKIISILLLLIPVLLVAVQYLSSRYFHGLSSDTSILSRFEPLLFLSSASDNRLLFGSGLFVADCDCLVRDSGLLVSFFYYYGALGLLFWLSFSCFFIRYISRRVNLVAGLFGFFALSTLKVAHYSGVFVFIFVYVMFPFFERVLKSNE